MDIVHGQMPETEMARVAAQFDRGDIDVLICTTIIENGIDLPNVNTLIVEDATKFGIGQLYQIRGRIGRGKVKAQAYFFYPEGRLTGIAAARLQILEEAKELGSGYQLAMRDLEMRGMGQMLGKDQHGHVQKIGLHFYGKLLRQAVEELESGHRVHLPQEISINLPIDYGIPKSLESDPEKRVTLYRLISASASQQELEEILYPVKEQMRKLNQVDAQYLEHLLEITRLRFVAEQGPLLAMDYQISGDAESGQEHEFLELTFSRLSPSIVDKLHELGLDLRVLDKTRIRIFLKKKENSLALAKNILALLARV
jgi:transcription-repair coupling factor (superfamily II helicase)